MKLAGQATALIAVLALLAWGAGEQHRANCIRQGRSACTALPWNTGREPRAAIPAGISRSEYESLLREARR